MSDTHVAYTEAHEKHHSAENIGEGACLIRHLGQYKKNDTCSYRWQGLEQARAKGRAAYDAHSKKRCHLEGRGTGPVAPSALRSYVSDDDFAGKQVMHENADKDGNFDYKVKKTGEVKKMTLVEVNNFTTGFAPYGNQVHHILNNSSLQKAINAIAEQVHEPIRETIANGLLEEKYNINHMRNMIILPTKNCDCKETGLPRHLGGHPTYSKQVLRNVSIALRPYKKIAQQAKDDLEHDKPDPVELKERLEKISDNGYQQLIQLAAANRAASAGAISINQVRLELIPPKLYRGA